MGGPGKAPGSRPKGPGRSIRQHLRTGTGNTRDMESKGTGDGREICVILSTVTPDRSAALARSLLEKRLVACINILPVRSLYRWKGECCNDEEHLLVMKTRRDLVDAAIPAIRAEHPYEVPEIIVLPVTAGHLPYLDWVYGETR